MVDTLGAPVTNNPWDAAFKVQDERGRRTWFSRLLVLGLGGVATEVLVRGQLSLTTAAVLIPACAVLVWQTFSPAGNTDDPMDDELFDDSHPG